MNSGWNLLKDLFLINSLQFSSTIIHFHTFPFIFLHFNFHTFPFILIHSLEFSPPFHFLWSLWIYIFLCISIIKQKSIQTEGFWSLRFSDRSTSPVTANTSIWRRIHCSQGNLKFIMNNMWYCFKFTDLFIEKRKIYFFILISSLNKIFKTVCKTSGLINR